MFALAGSLPLGLFVNALKPVPRIRAQTAAEIAKELVQAHKGSARAAVEALNKRGLPQNEVAEILTEVFRQTGRDIAAIQRLPDGTQVLLSRRVGDAQPVIAINKTGKSCFWNC